MNSKITFSSRVQFAPRTTNLILLSQNVHLSSSIQMVCVLFLALVLHQVLRVGSFSSCTRYNLICCQSPAVKFFRLLDGDPWQQCILKW